MTEERSESYVSDSDRELLKILRESNAINFDKIGDLVARVTPEIFSGRAKAGDYIITVYESFLHVFKLGIRNRLDTIAQLRESAKELGR